MTASCATMIVQIYPIRNLDAKQVDEGRGNMQ